MLSVTEAQQAILASVRRLEPEAVSLLEAHETPRCGSHNLPFIGRAEFLRNRRAAGRLKDLADIEALEG